MAVTIIICSRNKENLDRSIRSIRKTIGLDFEILSSFQSSQFGLSKIYNELALQAKYDNIKMNYDLIYLNNYFENNGNQNGQTMIYENIYETVVLN